jgi:hypothetical protein
MVLFSVYNDDGHILIDDNMKCCKLVSKVNLGSLNVRRDIDWGPANAIVKFSMKNTGGGELGVSNGIIVPNVPNSIFAITNHPDVSKLVIFRSIWFTGNNNDIVIGWEDSSIDFNAINVYFFDMSGKSLSASQSGAGLEMYNEKGEVTFSSDNFFMCKANFSTITGEPTNYAICIPRPPITIELDASGGGNSPKTGFVLLTTGSNPWIRRYGTQFVQEAWYIYKGIDHTPPLIVDISDY